MHAKWMPGLAVLLVLAWGAFVPARAATEVKMTGDARVYGVFFAVHNFTGWNSPAWTSNIPTWIPAATKAEERLEIWERFRLRTDFVANEAVKFRLGVKVEDTWGHGTFTAANPQAALAVYQAYLQFKWPDCDIEITAGLQDVSLPQSKLFYDSIVFGGDRMAALTVAVPLLQDRLSLLAGFGRLIDTNRTYDPTTTQVADELDAYFLALPITLDGFKVTPWGAVAVAGRNAGYYTTGASTFERASFAENLITAGSLFSQNGWKNAQNAFWWAGGAGEMTLLDPFRFYADVIYGAGAQNDRKENRRSGWFADAGAEYTGWSLLTPQVFGWWSTGEDNSITNGSERMPQLRANWGPANSFLFDDSQELAKNSNMGMNPVGSWGFGASLNNISYFERFTHRLTYTFTHGNNSDHAMRFTNFYLDSNPYFVMGRDLTRNEYAHGVNFDTKYMIYENLAAVLETGWAKGWFQQSVWGHRLWREARDRSVYKVALGLTYRF